MHEIKFFLPDRVPSDRPFEAELQAYAKWIGDAPLVNAYETGEKICQFIARGNRVQLNRVERLRLLDLTLNNASHICSVLEDRRQSVRAIVNPQFIRALKVEGELLDALVTGYKIVVSDGLPSAGAPLADTTMRKAIVEATHLSVTRLTNAYAGYNNVPQNLWYELHQLYELSNELGGVRIAKPASLEGESSLKACIGYSVAVSYKAALLLAMFDPNRLMEGEADAVYLTLLDWSAMCQLTLVEGGLCTKGSFIVDSSLDSGPHFVSSNASAAPQHGLQVDVSKVIELIDERICKIISDYDGLTKESVIPFQVRVERDLLHRLCTSLKGRHERRHERKQQSDTIELVAGFNTAHHLLRGGDVFTPEVDEFNIHHIDYTHPQPEKSQLSLVPMDLESAHTAQQELDEFTLAGGRSSQFDPEEPSLDVWSTIYAAPLRAPGDEQLNPVTHWQIINRSASGLALQTSSKEETGARVGGLIVFKSRSRSGQDHWYLATVRWMSRVNGVSMGLRVLAVDLKPVALRAVEGVGAGCEYLRGFFVPGRPDGKSAPHLFTPPAIFDRNTLLAINDSQQLYYAHLDRLNETTRLYSLFDVCIKPMPESEALRVEQLRKLYLATGLG